MKKASKPGGTKKPAQKKPPTKLAKPKKAQGGAGLAEVIAELSRNTETLAQAADKLAEAAARLSAAAEALHGSAETPSRSATNAIPRRSPNRPTHQLNRNSPRGARAQRGGCGRRRPCAEAVENARGGACAGRDIPWIPRRAGATWRYGKGRAVIMWMDGLSCSKMMLDWSVP